MKMLVNTEFDYTNHISAINLKVISVAAYSMNVWKFIKGEQKELNQTIKKEFRSKQSLEKQASDERI